MEANRNYLHHWQSLEEINHLCSSIHKFVTTRDDSDIYTFYVWRKIVQLMTHEAGIFDIQVD